MRIYLVTHAHTEQIAEVSMDLWRLSKRGLQEAKELARAPLWSDVDRVVVSSEAKTWLTVADVVQERNLPVWVDCRFDELRRHGWFDNYSAQVAKVFAEPSHSVAGWEAADATRRRAIEGVVDLKRQFQGKTIAIVGHGLCLSLLRAELLALPQVDHRAWERLSFASYAHFLLDPPALIEDFAQSANRVR